jgi:hypothetical protein
LALAEAGVVLVYWQLHRQARPVYDEQGALTYGGANLASAGVNEYVLPVCVWLGAVPLTARLQVLARHPIRLPSGAGRRRRDRLCVAAAARRTWTLPSMAGASDLTSPPTGRQVPAYALFKLWTLVLAPWLFSKREVPPAETEPELANRAARRQAERVKRSGAAPTQARR